MFLSFRVVSLRKLTNTTRIQKHGILIVFLFNKWCTIHGSTNCYSPSKYWSSFHQPGHFPKDQLTAISSSYSHVCRICLCLQKQETLYFEKEEAIYMVVPAKYIELLLLRHKVLSQTSVDFFALCENQGLRLLFFSSSCQFTAFFFFFFFW